MNWRNLLLGGPLLLGLLWAIATHGVVGPTAHADLARLAGCAGIRVEAAVHERTTVLVVTAADCRGAGVARVTRAVAIERIARAVWESSRRPVDVVRIHLPDGDPVTLLGDDLAQRYELSRAASTVPMSDRLADSIWFVLPVGYVVAAVLVVAVVRRLGRSGVAIMVLRW